MNLDVTMDWIENIGQSASRGHTPNSKLENVKAIANFTIKYLQTDVIINIIGVILTTY